MDVNKRLKGIYAGMKDRCYNSRAPQYVNYGGRGIRICKEWLDSYTAFETWALEKGYSDDLSIDRINVNGNYEPGNCRWVDKKVQANNKRHYWLPQDKEDFVYEGTPDKGEQERKRNEIKDRLKLYRLSQVWLINQLGSRNLETDKSEMSSLLSGTRVGAKSEYILDMSLEILDEYQTSFVNKV